MPNCVLATTRHFIIEWWPDADSGGLYISESEAQDDFDNEERLPTLMTKGYALLSGRSTPQCFVDRELVPDLIKELLSINEELTLLSRVSYSFVPVLHRRPKKDGGVPGQAYYTPLVVQGEHRQELADALVFGCSKENVARLEENNSAESYCVLGNDYLENGLWNSQRWLQEYTKIGGSEEPAAIQLLPAKLDAEPKNRLYAPSHNVYGHGRILLRTSRTKRRCSQRPCIDYAWIKPEAQYVEHRHGRHTAHYHLKCAFRKGVIPINWLKPHFEQCHDLIAVGLSGWIEREREKREDYDEEKFDIPSHLERVTEFVQKLKSGYELDKYERQEWRDHLRHVPVDVEPYETARTLVGLSNPRK